MADWKNHHANESHKAVEHHLVQEAIEEFAGNMGFKLDGLPGYGMTKVALYAAQVARAQALSFDPDLLRMSDEEANRAMLSLAKAAARSGKPVFLIQEGEE